MALSDQHRGAVRPYTTPDPKRGFLNEALLASELPADTAVTRAEVRGGAVRADARVASAWGELGNGWWGEHRGNARCGRRKGAQTQQRRELTVMLFFTTCTHTHTEW